MRQADVIIVNYNSGSLLAEAVGALEGQPVAQIIVVDNASSDDSLSLLPEDGRLSIVGNAANLGFAAACNIGIAHSHADALLFLNPDARLDPGALDRLLDVLFSAPDIGMTGGMLVYPDGREQRGGRRRLPTPASAFALAFNFGFLRRIWPQAFPAINLESEAVPEQPIAVEAISGACMLVKRTALEQVGHWDDGYFLHCEDLDWCKRFALAGMRVMFVPDARVTHVKGASSGRRLFVEWHKHLGMRRYYRKFHTGSGLSPAGLFVDLGIWLHLGLVAASTLLARAKTLVVRARAKD